MHQHLLPWPQKEQKQQARRNLQQGQKPVCINWQLEDAGAQPQWIENTMVDSRAMLAAYVEYQENVTTLRQIYCARDGRTPDGDHRNTSGSWDARYENHLRTETAGNLNAQPATRAEGGTTFVGIGVMDPRI